MERSVSGLWLPALVFFLALSPPAEARKPKTIAFVPDPSCRSSRLVVPVEAALEQHLKVRDLSVARDKKDRASILLQYFLLVRKDGDRIVVQLDGRAFGNVSGKLLAEATASSEPHDADNSGREAAARQAGQMLAEGLSASLEEALWASGKGRRVMLQISLASDAGLTGPQAFQRLQRSLAEASPRLQGSTERNLVVVLQTSARQKELADRVEQALVGSRGLRVDWVVKSQNSLILRLVPESQGGGNPSSR